MQHYLQYKENSTWNLFSHLSLLICPGEDTKRPLKPKSTKMTKTTSTATTTRKTTEAKINHNAAVTSNKPLTRQQGSYLTSFIPFLF